MEPRLDYYTASPQALKGMLMLEATTFGLSIEKPLLELIKIRVSQLNHCGFCTDMHSMAARQRGESERRLFALCVWRDSPFFTAREKAALAWSESVATLPTSSLSDEFYAATRLEFSEEELVDLTMAVSSISGWNRLAVSFRQQPPNN
ncbi:carboxymuconolactone decarboxylase family protein [Pseudomonas sp. CCM 7891]|uniref:Carboxymuconolactone decarboxylase family protein n=1 Tax=Pseudomonas karstica TaxID=1055468 RepID=A0A7X2RZ22_9PSED|nr:carboxymuconolactone decarboxylase family protein [Pseudomonas karstica]MTD21890.1 carboxymuconolactone decarboxylase family protein [Pseudomonas karstica]